VTVEEPETPAQLEEPVQAEQVPTAKEEEPIVETSVTEETEKPEEPVQAEDIPVVKEEEPVVAGETSTEPEAPVEEYSAFRELMDTPKEQSQEESAKDSDVTAEVIGAGAAAAVAGVAAVSAASALHKEPESTPAPEAKQESTATESKDEPAEAKAETEVPEDSRDNSKLQPYAVSTNNVSVPSFEADPDLAALAVDREALLSKLNQPSTDQLATMTSEQPQTSAAAKQPEAETEEPAQKSTEPASQLAPETAASNNVNEEDARPASQNRSVTAVSLNSAPDNWLKAFLRTVFVGFFGTIFAPFRRHGKDRK
jgi:hypothetical protein